MEFKVFFIITLIACVGAGGPAEYSISAPSIDGAFAGSSHEHTVKGHHGQNSHSQYSNAVDSAHSSVRVSSLRINNDAIGYAPHYSTALGQLAISQGGIPDVPAIKIAPAPHTAPAYISHAYAPAHHYGTPLIPSYGHGYPASAYAHGLVSPVLGHGIAAQLISTHGHTAPAISYSRGSISPYGLGASLAYNHGLGYNGHLAGAHYAAPLALRAAPVVSFVGGNKGHYTY